MRSRCIASITSFCWARNASPSFWVRSSFSFIIASTWGKAASDLTLGSHFCFCIASSRARLFDVRIRFDPARSFDDFQRIRRRHEHLSNKSVRIERDGRDQLLDLFFFECRLCGVLCDRRLRARSEEQQPHQKHLQLAGHVVPQACAQAIGLKGLDRARISRSTGNRLHQQSRHGHEAPAAT